MSPKKPPKAFKLNPELLASKSLDEVAEERDQELLGVRSKPAQRKRPTGTEDIDLFIRRQMSRPRIYGVHVAQFSACPGESTPGWYVRNKGNLETAKQIHADELECIRILAKKIKLP